MAASVQVSGRQHSGSHGRRQPINSSGEKTFALAIDGNTYTARLAAADALGSAIERAADMHLRNVARSGSGDCTPIAVYRGFHVTLRTAAMGSVRLGLRCIERPDALEYSTDRTLDPLQARAYGTGLIQRLDHVLEAIDCELKAAQDALARERTNLKSYSLQLATAFEHHDTLLAAQRELGLIEAKLAGGPGNTSH